ncbi:MAG: uncharacterized protein QOJ00_481 [Actinomycetota bacterium]|jgi:Lon protease-like protein
MTTEIPLPMFPLGAVALPGAVIPLHVFEDRYRQMVRDVSNGDGRFGIVLIERGSEVGGGDVRSSVGTRMRITEAKEFDDGRWAILAVGEDPIRIKTWLPDDPYPLALVERLSDPDGPSDEALVVAENSVRHAHQLASQLGYDVPDLEDYLVEDPVTRLWQLAIVTPCPDADKQGFLRADGAERRADAIAAAALDAAELFRMQLGGGQSP